MYKRPKHDNTLVVDFSLNNLWIYVFSNKNTLQIIKEIKLNNISSNKLDLLIDTLKKITVPLKSVKIILDDNLTLAANISHLKHLKINLLQRALKLVIAEMSGVKVENLRVSYPLSNISCGYAIKTKYFVTISEFCQSKGWKLYILGVREQLLHTLLSQQDDLRAFLVMDKGYLQLFIGNKNKWVYRSKAIKLQTSQLEHDVLQMWRYIQDEYPQILKLHYVGIKLDLNYLWLEQYLEITNNNCLLTFVLNLSYKDPRIVNFADITSLDKCLEKRKFIFLVIILLAICTVSCFTIKSYVDLQLQMFAQNSLSYVGKLKNLQGKLNQYNNTLDKLLVTKANLVAWQNGYKVKQKYSFCWKFIAITFAKKNLTELVFKNNNISCTFLMDSHHDLAVFIKQLQKNSLVINLNIESIKVNAINLEVKISLKLRDLYAV